MENSYRFFSNRSCRFFPCHRVTDESTFNCLFCYCPLYTLGEKCGGNFKYLGGIAKDCSDCTLPHSPRGYDYIVSRYPELMALAERKDGAGETEKGKRKKP